MRPASIRCSWTGIAGEAIPASIRIEAQATDKLEIGSVDARHVSLSSTDPAVAQSARKRIEDQIQGLRDARAAQDDAIKAAEGQQAFLDNLAKLPRRRTPATPRCLPGQWRELFGVIGTSRSEALKTVADAALKQREIDRSLGRFTEGAGCGRRQVRKPHGDPHLRQRRRSARCLAQPALRG